MVLHGIREAQNMGAKSVTFGATPAPAFEAVEPTDGVGERSWSVSIGGSDSRSPASSSGAATVSPVSGSAMGAPGVGALGFSAAEEGGARVRQTQGTESATRRWAGVRSKWRWSSLRSR